jgi:hypothetical protein
MQVQASLTAAAIGPRRLGAALVALLAATPLVGAARPSLRR